MRVSGTYCNDQTKINARSRASGDAVAIFDHPLLHRNRMDDQQARRASALEVRRLGSSVMGELFELLARPLAIGEGQEPTLGAWYRHWQPTYKRIVPVLKRPWLSRSRASLSRKSSSERARFDSSSASDTVDVL